MNKMSDFIKQMGSIPEGGLQTPQQIQETKKAREQMRLSGNSFTNHSKAYQQMLEGNAPKKQEGGEKKVNINESDTTKLIGALQVVKELLDCNLTENTHEIATKVKTIINKI